VSELKRRKKDIQQSFLLFFVRRLAKVWMFFDAKHKAVFDPSFNHKRKDPYVMLANHTFLFDVVHVPLPLKKDPFIVASHNLFTTQPLKFLLTEIAHAIPKSKGTSDIKAVKELIGAVKRGYPILIFPEGNTTFNGETNYIEPGTPKLLKKLKVDVVVCQVRGGYLMKPRWAMGKRKNRRVEMFYKTVITKEELKDMSIEEVSDVINKELYFNAYEYQRVHHIKHPGKELAVGIDNLLYLCPECHSLNTISAKGNEFWCEHCQTKGHIDDEGFLHGFKYDNLVDWDNYQKENNDFLKAKTFSSPAKFFTVNELGKRELLGDVTFSYKDNAFYITGDVDMIMPFDKVSNPNITLRRDFNIFYENVQYVCKIEQHVASFLRVIQDKY